MARPRYKVDLENVLSGATTYKEHLQTVEDGAPFWVHRWLLLLQSTCRIIRFGSFFSRIFNTLVFLYRCYVNSTSKFKGLHLPTALNC